MIKVLRKTIGILLAIAFAAFALPAIGGPQKIYSLITTVGGTVEAPTVIASIKNLSPPGTGASNIGSLTLTAGTAVSGLEITGVTIDRFDSLGNQLSPSSFSQTVTPTPSTSNPTSTIAITSINLPLKAQETLRVTMNVGGCGFAVPWNAVVYTGSNLTGNNFIQTTTQQTTDVACGTLACGFSQTVSRTDISGSVPVTVVRGPYNSDGLCNITADATNFFVNNLLVDPSLSVLLTWLLASQPEAAFQFTADINATNVLKLAWKNYPDGTPAFLAVASDPALTCSPANSVGDWFPRPYGNLLQSVTKTDKTIKVSPSSTPPGAAWPTNLPVNIIVEDELMVVTKINTNTGTWTVTRTNGVAHNIGTLPIPVVFTPLKTLVTATAPTCVNLPVGGTCPYSAGELAKSCLIPPSLNGGLDGGSLDGAYKIMGIGDPVFSGGDL